MRSIEFDAINMAKLTVCDLHKEKGQLVETIRFTKVPKHPELRVDLYSECMKQVSGMKIRDYVMLSYRLKGMDLSTNPGMKELVFKQLNIKD